MLKMKEIKIRRREGKSSSDFNWKSFKSFSDANNHIQSMARTAPKPDQGYDKVAFEVFFEGEYSYGGRLDMKYAHCTDSQILEKQMHNEAYYHVNEDNDEQFKEWAEKFLKNCQLGDDGRVIEADRGKLREM